MSVMSTCRIVTDLKGKPVRAVGTDSNTTKIKVKFPRPNTKVLDLKPNEELSLEYE